MLSLHYHLSISEIIILKIQSIFPQRYVMLCFYGGDTVLELYINPDHSKGPDPCNLRLFQYQSPSWILTILTTKQHFDCMTSVWES